MKVSSCLFALISLLSLPLGAEPTVAIFPLETGATLSYDDGAIEIGDSHCIVRCQNGFSYACPLEHGAIVASFPATSNSFWNCQSISLPLSHNCLAVCLDQGEYTVYVENRGAGSGSSSGGGQYGHAWSSITDEQGDTTCKGNYKYNEDFPSGDRDDGARCGNPGVVSHTFPVNDEQVQAIKEEMDSDSYNLLKNNCVNMVERQLNEAEIDHPSLKTMGVGDPRRVYDWIIDQED